MIYCVKIVDSYHLFVYGDHECYTAWQLGIIIVILPGLLLFPLCFDLAVRLPKKRVIGSSVFTVAIACPYFAIFLYFWRGRIRQDEQQSVQAPDDEEFVVRVLEAEEELFREEDGSLGWQIVQLYRTFLLNVITIGLTNPVYRSLGNSLHLRCYMSLTL